MKKTCENCQGNFNATKSRQRFCCRECASESLIRIRTHTCVICNATIEERSKRIRRVCSRECNAVLSKQRMREKFPISEKNDATIRRMIKSNYSVTDIRKATGMSHYRLKRYIIDEDLIDNVKFRYSRWSDTELSFLEKYQYLTNKSLSVKFHKSGFNRSPVAVSIMRRRLRLLQNKKGMSASQLSLCLGVSHAVILRDVQKKRLIVKQNDMKKDGNIEYVIKEADIREYITNNISAIDLAKVDKYWFLDLFTNTTAG